MRVAIREMIETIILSLLLFIGIQFAVQTYQVKGASMAPTLSQGQYLLVNKIVYWHLTFGDEYDAKPMFPFRPPEHGDVLVFNFPNDPSRDFVKRVIGTPGDLVEIREGTILVNGEEVDEPYIVDPDENSMESLTVPPHSFFVMGDNRRQSNDSRDWGSVHIEYIVGQALLRYWPPHEITLFPGSY